MDRVDEELEDAFTSLSDMRALLKKHAYFYYGDNPQCFTR